MQNKALTMATYVAKTFGWKVFPVNPSNKKPLISGWQRKATNQIKDLERLFSKHPSSMLGLPTGPINGISVIDFDIRKDVNGIDSFFEKKLSLPISSCAHTPSGGYHIYLPLPSTPPLTENVAVDLCWQSRSLKGHH